jgi:ABC-type thiamine transport system ATPase subunit
MVLVDGQPIGAMSEADPARADIGMLFQENACSTSLTVAENAATGCMKNRHAARTVRERVEEVLRFIGLAEHRLPRRSCPWPVRRVAIAARWRCRSRLRRSDVRLDLITDITWTMIAN